MIPIASPRDLRPSLAAPRRGDTPGDSSNDIAATRPSAALLRAMIAAAIRPMNTRIANVLFPIVLAAVSRGRVDGSMTRKNTRFPPQLAA